jgi:hypothetical protein
MKAYTLRLEDNVLQALKYISLEEHKSVKVLLTEMIEQKAVSSGGKARELVNGKSAHDREYRQVQAILHKVSDADVVKYIREDRER